MPFGNVEADIGLVSTNGINNGFIGFEEFTFVSAGADGVAK